MSTPETLRKALEFIATHDSSDWPERCRNNVKMARAALAQPQQAAPDTRKPCTCDGAGRGPGRACVVKAGGRLGELWRCCNGLEQAPAAEAVQPPAQAVRLTDGDVRAAVFDVLRNYSDDRLWKALTRDVGPYDVTVLRPAVEDIARALEAKFWAANGLRGE